LDGGLSSSCNWWRVKGWTSFNLHWSIKIKRTIDRGRNQGKDFPLFSLVKKEMPLMVYKGKMVRPTQDGKKEPLLVTKNDDLSSNLMDDGSRLDDEEREI